MSLDPDDHDVDDRTEPALALRWRVWCRALAVGCLVHLSLPDAHRLAWLVPNLVLAASALSLLFVPRPGTWRANATFLGVFVAKLVPLTFFGDQLTQSVLLALYALSALFFARTPPRPARGDTDLRDDAPHDATHARALRLLLLGVYGLAAFHKTNRDFLDPAVSCATGGMRLLADNWSLPFPEAASGAMWPHLFLATEAALVLFGVWRPAWALLVALVMHVPLTIVFAPAFAWVMLPGWVAFLRDEDLAHLAHVARTKRAWVLGAGLVPAALSATLYFRDHWIAYPAWQLVELSLWLLLAWLVVALVVRRDGALSGRLAWNERAGRFAFVPLVILLLNGTTPYLGLQFHHAAAMLSNLRIDSGCWNHLLVPESVRLVDPYVRVDAMEVGPDTPAPEALVTLAREALWHPASLRESITRWCEAGAAPIALELRFRERTIVVDDACTSLPLPSQSSGLFQTNLPRTCPARCIH